MSLLAVALLTVHVVTLTLDPVSQLRWLDAVLPFGSAWRPAGVGLGAIGCDLLIALVATSLLRQRIGRRSWRAVHWAAYAVWPLALAHSLGTGTDVGRSWFRAVALGCLFVVAVSIAWRCSEDYLDSGNRSPGSKRPVAPGRSPERPAVLSR